MNDGRLPKKDMNFAPEYKRKMEMLRKTWKESVVRGMSIGNFR